MRQGDWFIGAQGSAANYQVLGATAEDDLVLETLGVRGFESAGVGATLMHDSRDNEDMPTTGWFLNVNNIAYREALGGAESFDAYRVDLKTFWKHGSGHVLAVRQYNWLTSDAPSAAQATVILRGYKQGQYLSPYMSSLEVEERLSFNARWGATLFGGAAGLYGEAPAPLERSIYPTIGAGLQFVIKPKERMNVNLEYVAGHRRQPRRLSEAWLRLVNLHAGRTVTMRRVLVLAVVAVALAAGAFFFWTGGPQRRRRALTLHGNVDIRQVSLAFDGSGRIAEVRAEEGDHVRAGAVLATIDTRTFALQIDQATAQIEAQEQNLRRLRNGARPEEINEARSREGRLASPGGTALLGLTAKPLKMRWMLRNDQLSCALKCPSRSEQRGRGEPRMLPSWDHHT